MLDSSGIIFYYISPTWTRSPVALGVLYRLGLYLGAIQALLVLVGILHDVGILFDVGILVEVGVLVGLGVPLALGILN